VLRCRAVLYCVMWHCYELECTCVFIKVHIDQTLIHSSLTYIMLLYDDRSVECVYKVRDATGRDHQSERDIRKVRIML
jgi:hypothetical protein